MTQTAFVTGATGFLGAHLARQLVTSGWEVTALVRERSSLRDIEDLGLRLRPGDVTDHDSVRAAMPVGVDAVFHVAASTNIWSRHNAQQTDVNVRGTDHVVRAAIERGAARFVHTSSFIVWGFHDGIIDEETPWTTGDEWINYLRTKRLAERRVHQAVESGELDAVICNPAHILGPGDRHNWSRLIRLVNQEKLPGVPPGGGAFADVREVARAHLAAWHQGERGANYILGGPDIPFLELIQLAGELLGKPVPEKASPAWLLAGVARLSSALARFTGKAPDITPEGAAMICRHLHCDSSRARNVLGYRFTPPRQLLEDTIGWMRSEGLLT